MVGLDVILFNQNPWWGDRRKIQDDIHLKKLREASLRIEWPLRAKIRLHEDRVYILRGPRQIGKTTLIKSLIQSLLEEGRPERNILYLALDIANIRSISQIQEAFRIFRELPGAHPTERRWVFLDEATFMADWATALKTLYDLGWLENTFVLVSGSSALDLRRGRERLPGRRGVGAHENDLELLPLSFRDFLLQKNRISVLPAVPTLTPDLVYQAAQEMLMRNVQIRADWEVYLRTGGFPLSINAYVKQKHVPPDVYATHQTAFVGEALRAGLNEGMLRYLLSALIETVGTPVHWQTLAKRAGMGSHHSAQKYVEDLAALYLLRVIPATQHLHHPQPAPRKRRKIYFTDPFLWATFQAWAKGWLDPYSTFEQHVLTPTQARGKVVESVIGNLLARAWQQVWYWQNRGEINFVVSQGDQIMGYVEVKYQSSLHAADWRIFRRKTKGGILVTKNELRLITENGIRIALVPAPLFAALLPTQ